MLDFSSSSVTLETAGGKGTNLAYLSRHGFPVPAGFIIPTTTYADFIRFYGLDRLIQESLNNLTAASSADQSMQELEHVSQRIREAFEKTDLPEELQLLLQQAYARLGEPAVAVRSSATAEDLPEMSFAGQHDTFLHVVGQESLRQAVRECWSSLWAARAIDYRRRNAIDSTDVKLAVVVQKMVQAQASGVLFTADPVSGRRTQTVIDATLGLGEALVSGQVEPDHYVVNHQQMHLESKTLGSKRVQITGAAGGGTVIENRDSSEIQAIPDEVILRLASLGQQVAGMFGTPQDIEWAWAGDELYLLQSRPITSLFPLPEGMPPEPLRVMMALSSVQGMMEPFTPLGQDALRYVLCGGGKVLGYQMTLENQRTFLSAADRLYIDETRILSNSIGQRIAPRIAYAVDPGIALAYRELVLDPRLKPKSRGIQLDTLRRLLGLAHRIVGRVFRFWRDPAGQRQRLFAILDGAVAAAEAQVETSGDLWQDYDRHLDLLLGARDFFPDLVIPNGVSAVVAGMAPFFGVLENFARQAARRLGQPELALLAMEIARGLPNNVTTEMDLALWETACLIRADEASSRSFSSLAAEELSGLYLSEKLPEAAQQALAGFLQRYGRRGLGEIDMGRPRWREDPMHVMQTLQSYLKIDDPSQAPDVVFERGIQASEQAAVRLEAAVRLLPLGWLRARLVRWAVRRYRALGGLREAPKFFAVRMMGIMRQGLLASGQAFSQAGLLDQGEDIFFLYFAELREIRETRTIPDEMRNQVRERRKRRQRELLRRQLPRVLLSDGTAYYGGVPCDETGSAVLRGEPVSPGVVEGQVRVILQPVETQLMPGEIMICPGTDPAWTPLFLSAGGLVMETGGIMTHGSVVAREYGIPAVVGVHEATRRLKTGQRIRLDGSRGQIEILEG